jgi:predicted nucleic acid-binding protein
MYCTLYNMDILLDASAIMAIILNEQNRDMVIMLTRDATLFSPEIISFEIGNALVNLYRKQKITESELLDAYKNFTLIPTRNIKIDIEKALKIACKYRIYAYDAYYLEIASRLKIPLITFDESMKRAAFSLKINILDKVSQTEG